MSDSDFTTTITTTKTKLISFHFSEFESTGDFLWTFSYPGLSQSTQTLYSTKIHKFHKKCLTGGASPESFLYFHHEDQWVYILSSDFVEETSSLTPSTPGNNRILITILEAKEFNPERYGMISKILRDSYTPAQNPVSSLEKYLEILKTDKCTLVDDQVFYSKEYDDICPFKKPKLGEMIRRFNLDSILIYNALLLNRRILVYHHDIPSLINFVLSLPAFVMHRNIWDSVYPWVESDEVSLSMFKTSKFHIIGTLDAKIQTRTDLYDLFINVPASELNIPPHSKESMTMTKTHKDIAMFMVQLTEKKGFTERDIMQEIRRKTKELIENLRSLGTVREDGQVVITLEKLKEKELSNTLETFLYTLAKNENMIHL